MALWEPPENKGHFPQEGANILALSQESDK